MPRGHCRYSCAHFWRYGLCITPAMAQEWFDVWKLINEQRMARQGWSLLGSGDESSATQPSFRFSGWRLRAIKIAPVAVTLGRAPWRPTRIWLRGKMENHYWNHRVTETSLCRSLPLPRRRRRILLSIWEVWARASQNRSTPRRDHFLVPNHPENRRTRRQIRGSAPSEKRRNPNRR